MRYYRYLYWLPGHAVPITNMVKISISAANILADPIISTPLTHMHTHTHTCMQTCVYAHTHTQVCAHAHTQYSPFDPSP